MTLQIEYVGWANFERWPVQIDVDGRAWTWRWLFWEAYSEK